MSVQLKLDAAAVAALFPEGSAARLELQQAVISETLRKIVDRNLSQTRAQIDAQVKAAMQEAIAAAGLTSKLYPNRIELTADAKKEIKEQVTAAYSAEVSRLIGGFAAPLMADIDARLKTAIDGGLRLRLDAMAREALRGVLK